MKLDHKLFQNHNRYVILPIFHLAEGCPLGNAPTLLRGPLRIGVIPTYLPTYLTFGVVLNKLCAQRAHSTQYAPHGLRPTFEEHRACTTPFLSH